MERQAIAAGVFRGVHCLGHPASYFIWLPLAGDIRSDGVVRELLQQRISVSTAEPFATTAQVPHALRIALGSVALDALEPALAQVRRTVEDHMYR
jgi:DNA-binding transcriptional MocR family regulator